MFRHFNLPIIRRACTRNFAAKRGAGRGAGRGRRNNNNNNNNNNNKLVRGPDYEEPSTSAASGMIYRLVGALGASAAVTGYLFFVYNPGVGDRRFGRQRAENDQYFEDDDFQDGDWDRGPGGRGGEADIGGGVDYGGSSDEFLNDNYESINEGGDYDPYARQTTDRDSQWSTGRQPSSEANNRSTWA